MRTTTKGGGELNIKPISHARQGWILVICFISALAVLTVFQTQGLAKKEAVKQSQKAAFALYQKNCIACHDSVADPEKPGRTRDDWHLVVNIMHGYGMDLTDADSEAIIDLLYTLRKGTEKEPG
jgi:mono/diheme cytochrome c family protein